MAEYDKQWLLCLIDYECDVYVTSVDPVVRAESKGRLIAFSDVAAAFGMDKNEVVDHYHQRVGLDSDSPWAEGFLPTTVLYNPWRSDALAGRS